MSSTMTEQTELFDYYTYELIRCYKCRHEMWVEKDKYHTRCRICHFNLLVNKCDVRGKTSDHELVKENRRKFKARKRTYKVIKCPKCNYNQCVEAQWRYMLCKNCRNQFDLRRAKIIFETKNYDCALELAKFENE